jgi:hypothetical protein
MVNDLAEAMEVELTLDSEIREGQLEDSKLTEIRQLIKDNKTSDFLEDSQGTLWLESGYVSLIRSTLRSQYLDTTSASKAKCFLVGQ